MKTGTKLIEEERQRQILQEGWTPENDDQHTQGELSAAAGSYALCASLIEQGKPPHGRFPGMWPFSQEWWKPSENNVRNLVKAGALIAAEIDRLQRKDA